MSRKILIVDDESEVLKFLLLRLENDGYSVRVAMDGETAVDLAKKDIPDLILLDINLPKIDGYEVASQIREEPSLNQTKIIFATADSRVRTRSYREGLKADDYLIKPFTAGEMFSIIEKHLNGSAPV